jgi:hypothetical protein
MSNNRIFILGAGASRFSTNKLEIPMPLARDFFNSVYVNELWTGNWIKENSFSNSSLLKIIDQYFSASYKKFIKEKKYHFLRIKSYINIEEVFSFLEFINQGYADIFDEKTIVHKARIELFQFIQSSLNHFTLQPFNTVLYDTIIRSFKEGDSIITYNWDLLVESSLRTNQKAKKLFNSLNTILNPLTAITNKDYYSIGLENLHKGYFLKLHGSINWGTCSSPTCLRHSIPFIFNLDEETGADYWDCDYCGSPLELMLLPPHVHKTYKINRLYSLQAKIAYHKLNTAREIIIIGYSFPDFDFEANSLFRKARLSFSEVGQSELFLQKVVIVNPQVKSPQYLNKVKDLFGLKNPIKYYGNEVQLETYSSVDTFLKNFSF